MHFALRSLIADMIEGWQDEETWVAGDNGALPDQQTAAGLAGRILMR
jgi:hypothetical protein